MSGRRDTPWPKPPRYRRSRPSRCPTVPAIDGVRFATAEAGIRYKGRTDLMVAVLDEGTVAAGVHHAVEDLLGAGAVVPRER